MEIVRVIVKGELPNGCRHCQYLKWDNYKEKFWCAIMNEYTPYLNTRPDWCPLVELDYDKLIEIWRDDAIKDR